VKTEEVTCPFCATSLLGRGFGAPGADAEPSSLRPEATLYGLTPVRMSDNHVPEPAYGLSPYRPASVAPWVLLALVLATAVALACYVFLR
jgi:hypothetical protein